MIKKSLLLAVCLLVWVSPVWAVDYREYLTRFEDRVTEFTLENGLQVLVIQRSNAPVASFVSFVDAGSVDEPRGKTGLAHMLEHMAFKGTPAIGTRDWSREEPLLKEMQEVFSRIRRERASTQPDRERLQTLRERLEGLREKAEQYAKPNEFSRIIERHGGEDLNAATSADYTVYQCSLPAHKKELWFSLESQRLIRPAWREFFTEKEVVFEERRTRLESNPMGRLIQQLRSTAYSAHPYRSPTLGWRSDLESLGMDDLQKFHDRYYRPGNVTLAVAGDIDPRRIRELAEEHFSSWEGKEKDPRYITREPEQESRKRFSLESHRQPAYVQAYHSVALEDPKEPEMDVLADILARGRTSRLYTSLVQEEEIASRVQALQGYPGEKHPSLFVFLALPHRDIELDELEQGLQNQLERLKKEGVGAEELERAKTRIRADLIRSLDSNLGLARSFVRAHTQRGDWRKVFGYLDRVEEVSQDSVQEAAKAFFQPENRTIGELIHRDQSGKGQ